MRLLITCLSLLCMVYAAPTAYNYQPPTGYSLVWQDEFDGPTINTAKWELETTCTPHNNEQQCYTSDTTSATRNAFVSNGMLNIVARQRSPIPTNANGKLYTSARMVTQRNTGSFKYGTFAARIKGPFGKGIWPAFWLLGFPSTNRVWPWVGEIDILEYKGGANPGEDDTNSMTLHYSRGNNTVYTGNIDAAHLYYGRSLALQNGARYADAFHIYECVWTPTSIIGRVDGVEFFYIDSLNTDHFNEFNHFAQGMNIILNIAVGGSFTGNVLPDNDPNFSQTMLVDWVRVYQQSEATIAAIVARAPPVPTNPVNPTGTIAFIESQTPTQIATRGTFSLRVAYTASHPSMMIAEIITKDSTTKYGGGTKMVAPGTAQDTIVITIDRSINQVVEMRIYIVAAEGYFHNTFEAYKAAMNGIIAHAVTVGNSFIYPTGASNMILPNPEGVVDATTTAPTTPTTTTAPTTPTTAPNKVMPNTPPLELTSFKPFTVDVTYTTTVQSVILIDLLLDLVYSKPASGVLTVQPGTNIKVTIPMTWIQGETGTTYFYNVFLISKSDYDASPTESYLKALASKRVENYVIINPVPTTTMKPTNAATATPTATQKPTNAATATPTTTQKPTNAATATPTTTEKPTNAATSSPITTTQPPVTQAPGTTTSAVGTTIPPVGTTAPETTQGPLATEAPIATRAPSTTTSPPIILNPGNGASSMMTSCMTLVMVIATVAALYL